MNIIKRITNYLFSSDEKLKQAINQSKYSEKNIKLSEKGTFLFEEGKFKEAISIYNQVLELDPNKIEVIFNKANAYYHLDKFQEASNTLDKALEIMPNDNDVLRLKIITLFSLKDFAGALFTLKKALNIIPNDEYCMGVLATVFSDIKVWDKAVEMSDKAINVAPHIAYNYVIKGNALIKLHDMEEAFNSFSKAIELEPNILDKTVFSLIREKFFKLKEDVKLYERAVRKEDFFIVHNLKQLASRHKELGNYKEAIKYLNNALSINPDSVEATALKSEILIKQKKYEDSILHLEKIWNHRRSNEDIFINKLIALSKLNKKDEILKTYRKLGKELTLIPHRFKRIEILIDNDLFDEATTILEDEMNINYIDDKSKSYYLLGLAQTSSNKDYAIESFTKAVEKDTENRAKFKFKLGKELISIERYQDALKVINSGLQKSPWDLEGLINKEFLLKKLGINEELAIVNEKIQALKLF